MNPTVIVIVLIGIAVWLAVALATLAVLTAILRRARRIDEQLIADFNAPPLGERPDAQP